MVSIVAIAHCWLKSVVMLDQTSDGGKDGKYKCFTNKGVSDVEEHVETSKRLPHVFEHELVKERSCKAWPLP